MLAKINSFIMDGLTTLMLIAFAVEVGVRVYGMTMIAIRKALRGDE